MINLWHISDVHLSMDKDFNPIKPMDQRRWSKGCSSFSGYLEKMEAFAEQNIKATDITVITGDVVHDMKEAQVRASLTWLRLKIPGTIVICRGNHDKYWSVSRVRQAMQHQLQDLFIVDEGEIITIGPYTFGCYSNHSDKTSDWSTSDPRYLEMAQLIGRQAKEKKTKAVMISHYPLNLESAEAVGAAGVNAYLSGHVHCTNNSKGTPDCADWDWYDQSAGLTDDKTINGCFFSTGTVDVLINKHKQPFKRIECLESFTVDHKLLNIYKDQACKLFGCNAKMVSKFDKKDPFNPSNELVGFICREKGPMQGSMYITHVNGKTVEPQLIYGTPKLAYPYKGNNSREYILFPTASNYFFAEKWNGMNVLVYKYKNASGKEFITAKSKGTPFLNDSDFGSFLSLTKEALKLNRIDDINKLSKHPEFKDPNVQSLSFELCGSKEPHLVSYNFEIDLKPLFKTLNDGNIIPLEAKVTPYSCSDNLVKECIASQKADHNLNLEYRKQKNLPHKYEYNHFAVEGKVLYLLDKNGHLIDRTMYKIKPEDVEEVHWETFGKDMQGRVREALHKIKTNDEPVNESTISKELDMGPKEWGRFGRVIMQYILSGEERKCNVLLLCGIPGSGKSTVAKLLEKHGYIRINQDELGSRNACKRVMEIALKEDKNIVIDRCNFDVRQRMSWIHLAHEFGVSNIRAAYFDTPKEVALERAKARINHDTIKDAEAAEKAVNAISGLFTVPLKEEGFIDIIKVEHTVDPETIVSNLLVNK